MAATFQINLQVVNYRLELLEKLQDLVITSVVDYISKIVSAGKSWIETRGEQETFLKIQQKIDNAVDFLRQKYQEISDQLETETSVEHTSQERQSIPKYEAGTQPSPAVTATSQQRHITQSGQDKDLLHQVSARFEVNEEAICSIRNNLEKVTEQQTDVDKRYEDVTAMLKSIQEQLNDLSKADEKQKKRLKEHTDKIAEKEAEIQKQESKLHSLEKQIKKLSTKQNKLEEESLSKNNVYEELARRIQDMSEDTESKISTLNTRLEETDSSVQDLLNRVGSQEQAIHSLCTKVDTNMETFETVSNRQEKNAKILRQFEDRMQETETRVREELEKVGGQFQETETSLQNVCQLLTKRLQPLEQLRDVLNQRAKARDDNLRQLQEIVKEVAIMSPKLTQLENQLTVSAVGFTAMRYVDHDITRGTALTKYHDFFINDADLFFYYNSGHFRYETGMFTAPVDGIYVISMSVYKCKDNDGELKFVIKHKKTKCSPIHLTTMFEVTALNEANVESSKLCLAHLEAGDNVFVEISVDHCNVNNYISFSCFMIR